MAEPLKFKENGPPVMPVINGEQTATFPNFLTSTYTQRIPNQKNDIRLKIFSGTANPLLAQVCCRFQNCLNTCKICSFGMLNGFLWILRKGVYLSTFWVLEFCLQFILFWGHCYITSYILKVWFKSP